MIYDYPFNMISCKQFGFKELSFSLSVYYIFDALNIQT